MTPKLQTDRELNAPLASLIHVQIDPPMLGRANMEIDESLLERLPPNAKALLRVYRWSEPTLSLGHFQAFPGQEASPWAKLPRVTRKTGGGAIVHHHELTYCIAIPAACQVGKKGHSEELYRTVHEAIIRSLRDHGWDAQLSETCTCKLISDEGSSPFLCFHRRSPVDVVVDGHKVVGSAQRRTKLGLIQHGSLLFRRSSYADDLFGLFELPRTLAANQDLVMGPIPEGVMRPAKESDADSCAPKAAEFESRLNEDWLAEILRLAVVSLFPKDSTVL